MKANAITSLTVFLRYPRPGKVKSRLAVSYGQEKAAAFYKLCAEQVFEEIIRVSCKCSRYIFYADREDKDDTRQWAGPEFEYLPQTEGDLGKRLAQAFHRLFDKGAVKAIILASDTPDISAEIITASIEALDHHDIVIGPSFDGGYYLIGMKAAHDELFRDISWSTEKVTSQTMKIIGEHKLSVYSMPELRDIDTEEDLQNWVKSVKDRNSPLLLYAETIGMI